jgi:CRP/FNR family transcriptional regulator, cyclic AMP receptor protein
MKMITQRKKTTETAVHSHQNGEFFKSLPASALADLEPLLIASSYSSNMVLFGETQPTSGVFVVLEGEVKLSVNSNDGRRLTLHIAQPGDVLGLSSTLSGGAYEMTADTLYSAKVAPISREAFLEFLSRHPEIYPIVSREIERSYNLACERLRTMQPSDSAPQRPGRLLLVWSDSNEQESAKGERKSNGGEQEAASGTRCPLTMTQEKMDTFIGDSCQTVFRSLSVYKNRERIAQHGCTVRISSNAALESSKRN